MNRVVSKVEIDFPFQRKSFFLILFCSLLPFALGLAITLIPKIGGTGLILILVSYFMPTLIAFDAISSYQDEYKIERLLHPKRFLIFVLNLVIGVTVLGWVVVLAFAFNPGSVSAERVDYFE